MSQRYREQVKWTIEMYSANKEKKLNKNKCEKMAYVTQLFCWSKS